MSTLVFCLEEPSAREMLGGLVPKLLPSHVEIRYLVFEGKSDLQKRLGKRLREWQKPDSYFIVLQDQDSADCYQLKQCLCGICRENGHPDTLVRIACHELESWYLGDLAAVEKGLDLSGLSRKQKNRKYRSPDALSNAADELAKLTQRTYQKMAGSRAIGSCLKLSGNRSKSFSVFITGLTRILERIRNPEIYKKRVRFDCLNNTASNRKKRYQELRAELVKRNYLD